MRRKFANYTRISFESLEKLVKLDSLKLTNKANGLEVLEKYENFINTHTKTSFVPRCLYSKVIQSEGDFPFDKVDYGNLQSKLALIDPVPEPVQLINLLSAKFIILANIKKVLLSLNYNKSYHPMELRTAEVMAFRGKLAHLVKITCQNISLLKISEWNTIIENIQFITYNNIPITQFDFDEDLIRPEDLINILNEASCLETSKLINNIKDFFPNYKIHPKVFEYLESSFDGLDQYEDSEVLQILSAFPPGDKLDGLKENFHKLIAKYKFIPANDLCRLVIKMIELKLPIPVEAMNQFENILEYIIEKNSNVKNLNYLKVLIESKMISKNILNIVCRFFTMSKYSDYFTRPILFDIYSLLYDNDSLGLVLNNDFFYFGLNQVSSFLNTNEILKVLDGLIYHIKDLNLLTPCIEKLKSAEISEKNIDKALLEKVLSEVLMFNSENPIYQYQFLSYKIVKHEKLKELAKTLKNILALLEPTSPLVFKYYNSTFLNEKPSEELERNVLPSNVEWARYVWRNQDKLKNIDVIRSVLGKANLGETDPESLYYITSFSKVKLDCGLIPYSDYSLAIMYNKNYQPSSFNEKINFAKLVTEAQIKTIIMLKRLKNFSQIKNAIEFLSFQNKNDPKVPLKVMRDFINTLRTFNKSNINYYAVSCILNSHYEIFTQSDLNVIRSLFYDTFTEIHPELAIKLKDLKNNEQYDRKKYLNLCMALHIQNQSNEGFENAQHELEKYLELRFLNKNRIISIIKNDPRMSKDPEVYVKIILELLAETQIDSQIFFELMQVVKKTKIWNNLDFKAKCNFFFILNKIDATYPEEFERDFLTSILGKSQSESININPANGFKCFKPFKYTTILEPRYVVSNDINTKTSLVEFSDKPELPKFIVANSVKALAYINKAKLMRTSELEESVRIFYKEKNKNNGFYMNKLAVHEDLLKIFKENEIEENFIDPSTFWVIDFWIPSKKLAIILLCENDFYIDEKFNPNVNSMPEVIKNQLKQISKFKVLIIDHKLWKNLTRSEKSLIIQEYD